MTSNPENNTLPERHSFWRKSLRTVVWLLIVLYFLATGALIAGRWFFTTQFQNYRSEITTYAGEKLGLRIEAEKITGGFSRFWPTITLENVTLSHPGDAVSLKIPRIEAHIAWSSLWMLQPNFERLQVSAPALTVTRLSENVFDVAGVHIDLANPGAESNGSGAGRFFRWLLAQQHLSLTDGDITYIDRNNPQASSIVHFTDIQLLFERQLLDWRAGLRLKRQGLGAAENITAAGVVKRSLTQHTDDPNTWDGSFYVKTDQVNIARLAQALRLPVTLASGSGATELWARFSNGHLQNVTADVDLKAVNLQLPRARRALDWPRFASRIIYNRQAAGESETEEWRVKHLVVQTNENSATLTNRLDAGAVIRTLSQGAPAAYQIELSEADFSQWKRLLSVFPFTEELQQQAARFDVDGYVENLFLKNAGDLNSPGQWQVEARFRNLSFSDQEGTVPGFENLTGEVKTLGGGHFTLTLNTQKASLTFPRIFTRERIPVDSLEASASIELEPKLKISVSRFAVSNAEASLVGNGGWEDTGGAGTLTLGGQIIRASADKVRQYLPDVLGKDLLQWLDIAIMDGKITSGRFAVNGPLDTFPWSGSTSAGQQFLIEGELEDGRFNFFPDVKDPKSTHPSWPLLTDIRAHLRFEGDGMLISASQVKSHGLLSNNAVVGIEHYSTPTLTVKGDITGDLKNGLGYVRNSALLNDIIGPGLSQSSGSGQMQTQLALTIPLDRPEKTDVRVTLNFSGNRFSYGYGLPEVKELNGQLVITENAVASNGALTGTTAAGPIRASVETPKRETRIAITGELNAQQAAAMLGEKTILGTAAAGALKGQTPVSVDISIDWDHPYTRIAGQTDLTGMASTLPQPFTKDARSAWPTTFNYELLEHDTSRLSISSPSHIEARVRFNQKQQPESGVITIGETKTVPAQEGQGLGVHIAHSDIDLDAWQALAPDAAAADSSPALRAFSLQTGTLHTSGQLFHRISVDAHREGDHWLVTLDGEEIAGSVRYRPATGKNAPLLTGDLKRLHLTKRDEDELAKILHPKKEKTPTGSLPDLLLNVSDLRLNRQHIGRVSVDASNDGEQIPRWYLRSLKIMNPGGLLSAHGVWYPGEGGKTRLDTTATITDIGKVLSSLEYANAMQGAPGTIKSGLSWVGSPLDFNTATLNGSITGELGQGKFLQIEPGAGRILSLLSLQHLLRRLTLDFRDVLGKGFAFDSVNLEGEITNGILTIPKSTVLGSAASVVSAGEINLPAETLNLRAVILPSINAGGPSLALALINPAIGIGTFVSQWLLKDQLSQFFKSEYAITGDFDNPTVTRIDAPKQEH